MGECCMELVAISLQTAVERRSKLRARLAPLGLAWSIRDASTEPPPDLPYHSRSAMIDTGRNLGASELGCFASHYLALRDFVRSSKSTHLMVIEDDVLLDPGFAFDGLPGLMSSAGIEYLRLYSRFLPRHRILAGLGSRLLVRFETPAYGTQAYVVSRHGAGRLIGFINRISRPIDDEFDRFWRHGLPGYALFPYPVLELESPTTVPKPPPGIGPRTLWLRALHYWTRVGEKLAKEASNVRLRLGSDRSIRRTLCAVPPALAAERASASALSSVLECKHGGYQSAK